MEFPIRVAHFPLPKVFGIGGTGFSSMRWGLQGGTKKPASATQKLV
jgi:hypothetical protein